LNPVSTIRQNQPPKELQEQSLPGRATWPQGLSKNASVLKIT
jgi:hypothetical protein